MIIVLIPGIGQKYLGARRWIDVGFAVIQPAELLKITLAIYLAKWLETAIQKRTRAFTYDRLKNVDLSIVLSKYNRADAEKLFPRRIHVVSNGIPDPCPDFERHILPRRAARFAARQKLAAGLPLSPGDLEHTGGDPRQFKVLYLAHCTREKGLFDTIKGLELANARLAQSQSPFSIQLMVAGNFVNAAERAEFDRLCDSPEGRASIRYLGFVSSTQKDDALREADLFCFPTYYQNENQPVNLIEAMAFGLPILTTRWRSLPELLPPGYRCLVDIRSPEQIGDAFITSLTTEAPESFRQMFQRQFTLEKYLAGLAEAFHAVESADDPAREMTLDHRQTAPNPPPAR